MKAIRDIISQLEEGQYDRTLSYIYCRPADQTGPLRRRIRHVMEGFQETFCCGQDKEVIVCSAPGRTEIGGNHTDHQRGKVLTGSVDADALACAAPNGTQMIRIFSEGFGMVQADVSSLEPVEEEKNTTLSIVRGIAAWISKAGYAVSGFDAYLISDVPGGSGLSSSACFEVLTGTLINQLFCDNSLSMQEIAKIGQYAENVYFGKPSGLMDQMGCAVGGIISIDFSDKDNPDVQKVNFDFSKAGHALCLVDTGADHADLTAYYASIPQEMKSVAKALGKEVLSETDEQEFYQKIPALRKELGDRAVLRAIHYYSDCRRVDQMTRALNEDDFPLFLQLVSASGQSSYMFLQNVTTFKDPKDQPVGVALALAEHCLKGKGAVRVHGGGFGGAIQVFVPLDMVDEFVKEMDAFLGEGASRVTFIRPVGGCLLAG